MSNIGDWSQSRLLSFIDDQSRGGSSKPNMVWRGNWSPDTAYVAFEVVNYAEADGGDGGTYLAIENGIGQEPTTETDYWLPLGKPETPARSGLSLGPYIMTQTIGFVNATGLAISLSHEVMRPAGAATITHRKKNGTGVDLPITLSPNDYFELRLTDVSGRVYVGYRVTWP